jgi:hypothetical protein
MPNNHIVEEYQKGNGYYCQTACNGWLCLTTDGCAAVQCRK